jgi:hypothetical protein
MADEPSKAEQDKLAEEWAAAAGGGASEGAAADAPADAAASEEELAGPTRVLNQNEIDSLLGFGEDDGQTAPSSIPRSSPMSAYRCSRSSSTASCA